MTQGQRLLMALRRKPRTYMELLLLGISTCPHKRIMESVYRLKPGEYISRKLNRRGLIVWSVSRSKA